MLEDPRGGRTRGRQVEATANDERILSAALRVLTANPRASMAEVAAVADVGVASVYRRFPSRNALARQLALYAMASVEGAARDALMTVADKPWESFVSFISAAMDAGAGSMRALAGTFTAGAELNRAGKRLADRMEELLSRAQDAGAVRSDLTALDLLQLFEMLRAIRVQSRERSDSLRRRYIAMLAPALRAGPPAELKEDPPSWSEIVSVWNP